MTSLLKRLLGGIKGEKPVAYEEARDLAASADAKTRGELAAHKGLMPEILYYLANDPLTDVRRSIAKNPSTPVQANLLLAKDADEDVRSDLALKIAKLAPGLGADEQDRIRRITYETLEMLARDQLPRVRRIIAETLKDVANAPPEIIRRLARDTEIVVAGPVLECSPVLTDDDLLEIISTGPIKGALAAISRRAGVGAEVADVIAKSEDVEAIAVLLGNRSAQIREETLDRLIERAPDIEMWHAPLVQRPHLSARAVGRIARFVADNLLDVLKSRQDLPEKVMADVEREVKKRLEAETQQIELRQPRRKGPGTAGPQVDPLAELRQLHANGKLEEADVAQYLSGNKLDAVTGALAVRTGLSLEVVRKAIETQSAKGMVAMATKAGLSMDMAVQLQTKLARVSPSALIRAHKGNCPLTPDEVDWQIGFFKSLVADAKAR
ncbi:MAG: DUF2336 domain-containing protein [Alphaproteobacteria bacterium]|nr:DUF2336 domain-containing protein [Alphaproteobacteria bacterium]